MEKVACTPSVAEPTAAKAPTATPEEGVSPTETQAEPEAELVVQAGRGGMQVPYEVRAATFGKGLFASEAIPAGACIWRRSAANLTTIRADDAEEYVAQLEPEALRSLLEYAYFGADGELINLSSDDGRFFNHYHSGQRSNVALGSVMIAAGGGGPNGTPSGKIEAGSTYALRDIAAGKELLDDYNTYHPEPQWYLDLLATHGVDTSYLHAGPE